MPEQAPPEIREAEAKAEQQWHRDWAANAKKCKTRFKDLPAYLAACRSKFRAQAVIGTRQHRGIAQ